MIKQREKLGNFKDQSTCLEVFDLFWVNKMSENNICIGSWTLFKSTQLIRMNKIRCNRMIL